MRRLLPILGWLPHYDRRWLRGDVVAGIAVTALIVPKNLGYAGIAGMPLENGLYAAAAGAIIYALFCTSRQISTGPSSSLAAVAGGAVLVTSVGGEEAAQLVAAITLVTGRAVPAPGGSSGWAGSPSSSPGRSSPGSSRARRSTSSSASCRSSPARRRTATAPGRSSRRGSAGSATSTGRRSLVGAVALVAILGLRFVAPKVPGALVLVVGGLSRRGCSTWLPRRGTRRRRAARPAGAGRSRPATSSADHVAAIVIAAVALLLIGFSQTAGDARAFATRHRYRIDVNQESVAQGMANLGAGVFQGMPVSTSLSASSLNESPARGRRSRRS